MQGIDGSAVSLDVQQVACQISKQHLIGGFGKGGAEFADGNWETVATIAGQVEIAEGLRKAGPQGGASVIVCGQGDRGAIHMRGNDHLHSIHASQIYIAASLECPQSQQYLH